MVFLIKRTLLGSLPLLLLPRVPTWCWKAHLGTGAHLDKHEISNDELLAYTKIPLMNNCAS